MKNATDKTTCWPWLHRWGKWLEYGTVKGELYKSAMPGIVGNYTALIQNRTCDKCGLIQSRRVSL